MFAAPLYSFVLVAPLVVGGIFDLCKPSSKHSYGGVSCCAPCGQEYTIVQRQVAILLTSPNGKDRNKAARGLRDFDWKCHPEIAPALVEAMLRDCDKKVRKQSAESLAKLAPCLPEVHLALQTAATHDPNLFTRHWAKKGLKNLEHRCIADCTLCGPVPTHAVTSVPPPSVEFVLPPGAYEVTPFEDRSSLRPAYPDLDAPMPPEALPQPFELEPPAEVAPPDLPPASPSDSPFLVPPEASRRNPPSTPAPSQARPRFSSLFRGLGR